MFRLCNQVEHPKVFILLFFKLYFKYIVFDFLPHFRNTLAVKKNVDYRYVSSIVAKLNIKEKQNFENYVIHFRHYSVMLCLKLFT